MIVETIYTILAIFWNLKIPSNSKSIFSTSNKKAIRFLFPKITLEQIKECRLEFWKDSNFFAELNKKMKNKRNRECGWKIKWYEFLYMAIRFSKPSNVFETGVFDGQSSSVILLALKNNQKGFLTSIDLPASKTIKSSTNHMQETTLPANCKPGWLIPDYLRKQHCLLFGDSKELLPKLFGKSCVIDVFLHDSLHTFEHQSFEYELAWNHLCNEGILLSDDILWNSAFHKFCKKKNRNYKRLNAFGVVKKWEQQPMGFRKKN